MNKGKIKQVSLDFKMHSIQFSIKNKDIFPQGLRFHSRYSSCLDECPLYPIASCLPHLF